MGIIIFIAFGLAMDAVSVSITSGLEIKNVKFSHAFRFAFAFGAFQTFMPLIGWLLGLKLRGFISSYDHWIAFGLLSLIGCKMLFESVRHESHESDKHELNESIKHELNESDKHESIKHELSESVEHESHESIRHESYESFKHESNESIKHELSESVEHESHKSDKHESNEKVTNPLCLKTSNLLILSIATSIDALSVGLSFAFLKIPITTAVIIIGTITFILCFIAVYIGSLIGSFLGNKTKILGGLILISIGIKILIEHIF